MMSPVSATRDAGPRRRDGGPLARVPKVFAVVLLVVGLLCAWAAVSLSFGERTHPLRAAVDALALPAPANFGYAAFLVVFASGVAKRKRVAYWMLVAYFTIQLAFDVFILIDRRDRGAEAHRLHIAWYEPWAGLANRP
jgi:lysyl-tRNA synthetase, class II